jgi:cytochrome b subunit of formate dehydrogenase
MIFAGSPPPGLAPEAVMQESARVSRFPVTKFLANISDAALPLWLTVVSIVLVAVTGILLFREVRRIWKRL